MKYYLQKMEKHDKIIKHSQKREVKNSTKEEHKMRFSLATATIFGLDMRPHTRNGVYEWSITFCRQTVVFDHIDFKYLGNNMEEAEKTCIPIKEQFLKAGIESCESVVVLIDAETSKIRAISKKGSEYWIDVQDKFALKTFDELKINVTSLIVY